MIDADFLADSKKKIDAAKIIYEKEKNAVWPFLNKLLEAYCDVFDEFSDFNQEYADMLYKVGEDLPEFNFCSSQYIEIIDYSFKSKSSNLDEKYLTVFVSASDVYDEDGYISAEDAYIKEIEIPIKYAFEEGLETLKEIYAQRKLELEDYKNKEKLKASKKSLDKKRKQYEKLKKELGL